MSGIDSDPGDSDAGVVHRLPHGTRDEMAPNFDELQRIQGDENNMINDALKDMTPRWRSWTIRVVFSCIMISTFAFLIWVGPLGIMCLVYFVEVAAFYEVITIGYIAYRSYNLPWFRLLSWSLLLTSNYYFCGETMIEYFGIALAKKDFLTGLVKYHRFISFTLYVCCFVGFVLSLKKKYYLRQFTLFGWTHMALLIVSTAAHCLITNMFEGVIWVILPISLIVCNDIFAYIFGFFFGKTPLIKLSPKKTWEGFIGGGVSTVLVGVLMTLYLIRFEYMICPVDYDEVNGQTYNCTPHRVFQLQEYALPSLVQKIFALFQLPWRTVTMYPMVFHSIAMSIFASTAGPFGGFFASGFKRAFKIKDFGSTIPGHGGIMDRNDCQMLMAVFVKVYFTSFVKGVQPARVVALIMALKPHDQLEIYELLKGVLESQGLLGPAN